MCRFAGGGERQYVWVDVEVQAQFVDGGTAAGKEGHKNAAHGVLVEFGVRARVPREHWIDARLSCHGLGVHFEFFSGLDPDCFQARKPSYSLREICRADPGLCQELLVFQDDMVCLLIEDPRLPWRA